MSQAFLPYIGAFMWIGFLMWLGTIIRAKVTLFQNFLMPASLIGGIIGFILMRLDLIGLPTSAGFQTIPTSTFTFITFHLFAFNFVGIGLIKADQKQEKKKIAKGVFWIALMLNVLMAGQVLLGIAAFAGWNIFTGGDGNILNGALLAAGFTQGPGQAQAYGTVWEGLGVSHAVNIGFTFAAAGFLVAGLVGVFTARTLVKSGKTADKENAALPKDFLTGLLDPQAEKVPAGYETTHNGSINSLGYHFALMLFLYGVTFLVALALEGFLPASLKPMAFGMLFMFGLVVSIAYRSILTKLQADYTLDNGLTKSITSSCVDLLICAVFLGINVAAIQDFIGPIVLAVVFGTIFSVFITVFLGSKLTEFGMERAMVTLGYGTGTGANALLLLRVVDPKFKSPVLVEMGLVVAVQAITFTPFFSVVMPLMPNFGLGFSMGIMALAFLVSAALVCVILWGQHRNKTA